MVSTSRLFFSLLCCTYHSSHSNRRPPKAAAAYIQIRSSRHQVCSQASDTGCSTVRLMWTVLAYCVCDALKWFFGRLNSAFLSTERQCVECRTHYRSPNTTPLHMLLSHRLLSAVPQRTSGQLVPTSHAELVSTVKLCELGRGAATNGEAAAGQSHQCWSEPVRSHQLSEWHQSVPPAPSMGAHIAIKRLVEG